MTNPIDDGGPAFPQVVTDSHRPWPGLSGMSLRDWFAGQALAGVLANTDPWVMENGDDATTTDVATFAYATADSMLSERSKQRSA